MSEYKNKKTTCNKKSTEKVLPEPTAAIVAEIVGVSPSYVKKVREGTRPAETETAKMVVYCNELLVDGGKVLVEKVTEVIHNKQNK